MPGASTADGRRTRERPASERCATARVLSLAVGGAFIAASAAAQPFAYVATAYNDTITIIDAATNRIAKTIDASGYPLAVAASSDGRWVFVANVDSSTISVVDTATKEITRAISLPARTYPQDLAVSADDRRLYTISVGSATPKIAGMLFTIDIATGLVAQTLALPDDYPLAVRSAPDGDLAYVANSGSDSLSIIDTETNTVIVRVPVGRAPVALALSPDGALVYTANAVSSTVSVVDTAAHAVTHTIPVGYIPRGIAVSPEGTSVDVANRGSNSIYVIDAVSNTLRDAIFPVGVQQPGAPPPEPYGVAVTPDGTAVYVTNETSRSVSAIDAACDTVVAEIPVSGAPRGIVIPPPGSPFQTRRAATPTPTPLTTTTPPPPPEAISRRSRVYVANVDSQTISVINTATNSVTATIPVAVGPPTGIAFTPDGAFAYVTAYAAMVEVINAATDTFVTSIELPGAVAGYTVAMTPDGRSAYVGSTSKVFVIDTESNTVRAVIPGGNIQSAIAFTPDGAVAYVADSGGGSLMVIDTRGNTVTTTVPIYNPQAVAVSPDARYAYVTAGNLFVVDTASNAIVADVPAGAAPGAIALSPDGSVAYVGSRNDSLFVLDTATRKIIDTIYPVPGPSALVLAPGGSFAYVADISSDTVTVVNLLTRTPVAAVPVGQRPSAIALALPPLTFCVGDCGQEREVTVDELLRGIRIALGEASLDDCPEFDADGDDQVTIDELMQAISNALNGCPPAPATAIPTPTPTKTPAPGECAYVCDGRACNAVCPDGSPRLGYCDLTAADGCQCVPFECPYACVAVYPVTSPWDQLIQTVRGYSVGQFRFGANIRITGGAQPVSGSVDYNDTFAIDVPLNPGLNQLSVYSYRDYPPCSGTLRTDNSGQPLDILVVLPTSAPTAAVRPATRGKHDEAARRRPL
jgi:YVTN family beta-propeller protein